MFKVISSGAEYGFVSIDEAMAIVASLAKYHESAIVVDGVSGEKVY